MKTQKKTTKKNDLKYEKPFLKEIKKPVKKSKSDETDHRESKILDKEFFKNAIKNPFYKPLKVSTTVRVDADILMWLKSKGKGYQTKINDILRSAMITDVNNV